MIVLKKLKIYKRSKKNVFRKSSYEKDKNVELKVKENNSEDENKNDD